MELRDARWRQEIAAGIRPAPPHLIRVGAHKAGRVRTKPPADTSLIFLPATFLPSEPGLRPPDERHILAPQTLGASFAGISLQDQYSSGSGMIPPDTCGAIGPNHYIELINGSAAIYNRAGTRLSHVTLNAFMAMTYGGVNYPTNYAFDPRIVYDRRSSRFFAVALDAASGTNNHMILAVSRTSDPTGVWDKYLIAVGKVDNFTDFPALGVDDNGVYIPVGMFPPSGFTVRIACTRKASLIAGSPSMGTVYYFEDPPGFYATPQAAVNFDAVSPTGRAWIIGANAYAYDNVNVASITWPVSGAPSISSVDSLSTPAFAQPPSAPAKGSTINIDTGDMRMQPAMIRGNRLYAARHIGVNGTGGATGADRCAVEWYEIDVSTASASVLQSGRLYDAAGSDPLFFFYPSIAVNGLGQMAVSFSDSNGSRYVAAETAGRLEGDSAGTLQSVLQIKPGSNKYTVTFGGSANRWGDYSASSVDPNDDLSIWTIQEYATGTQNIWGTWVAQLMAPAPTLNNPAATGQSGTSGYVLNLTGTGIFDPGSGFPNRLAVVLNGGSPNGISNYAINYISPTSVQVTFDIAANASAGARDIVLTNPDGQSATVAGGFTVQAGYNTTLVVNDIAGVVGETVTLQATLTRTSDGTGVSGKTVSFSVAGVSVGSGTTSGSGVASVSYTIPEAAGIGANTISASFAGDPPYGASSGSGTLTVNQAPTTTAVTAVSGKIRESIQLQATLTRTIDSLPLSGRTLEYRVDGTSVGTATTNGSGVGALTYTIPEVNGIGAKTIRADFAGDAAHLASFGTNTLTVAIGDTTLAVDPISGPIGQTVTLSATLLCASDALPVSGRTVAFLVDGSAAGSAGTNASGIASVSYVIPVGPGPGSRTIQADFAGDAVYTSSTDTDTLTVQKADTTLAVSAAAGAFNDTVTLSAVLSRTTDGALLAGKLVAFSVEGTGVGDGTTDGSGSASVTYTIPEAQGRGSKTIGAAFAGDADHNATSGSGSLTVTGWPATLAVQDAAGSVAGTVTLSALLTRTDNAAPLAGRTVTFTVQGTAAGSGVADASGLASSSYVIPDTIGSGALNLEAAFAGDAAHEPTTDTGTLTVTKVGTSLYVPPRTGTITESVALRGYLSRPVDGAWVQGRTISFSIDGTAVGSAVTNGSGRAELNWTISSGAATRTIAGAFTGDGSYTGSSGSGTLTAQSWTTKIATFDRTQRISGRTELKARLLRSDNVPLYNKSIDFSVDG
ncbi:MAG: Ig-like domain repeat protein, partial [Chthonomonadales bacterium]|nr:Ig-like domain repeat protein [Chthonomonadales bacterium]